MRVVRVFFGSLLFCSLSAGVSAQVTESRTSGRPSYGNERELVVAAREGDIDVLRSLLDSGVSARVTDEDGSTALLWASYRDDLNMTRLLIDAGAVVNAPNDLGATPLWAAGQNGSAAATEVLLAAGADPNIPLLSGETALMVAARSGHPVVVKQLADAGAALDRRALRGQTALMWAVSQKHADVVRMLIMSGADIHARSDVWTQVMAVPPHGQFGYNREIPHGGNTPLMFAARVGDLKSAKLLVEAGANVDDSNAWGVSATVMAAHSGYRGIVELLLNKGANPNARRAGFTALHEAIMRRDSSMVKTLLTHGANPNVQLETWTPIRRASRDFNFQPPLIGATPFWLAARFREVDLMRLLVLHGADPLFVHHADYIADGSFERQMRSTTTLMAALGMGGGRLRSWVPPDDSNQEARVLAAAKLAVELGVDVNATDTNGHTALDEAEALQLETVVRFLVEVGAKPSAN